MRRRIWIGLSFFLVLALLAPQALADDRATVVVFSRHSFRGVSSLAKPIEVTLGENKLELPLLGYARDSTISGLETARLYGGPAIHDAAERAVADLERRSGSKPKATSSESSDDGFWDEVRVDMSVGRDFFTGLYFRHALQPFQEKPIALTGYPTERTIQRDAVLGCDQVRACLPAADIQKLQRESVGAKRSQAVASELLDAFTEAMGLAPVALPPLYDESGQRAPVYNDIHTLASTIEMVSEQGPPLKTLFPDADPERIANIDPVIGQLASNYMGVNYTVSLPAESANAAAAVPLEYTRDQEGRRVILATHDDVLSVLVRSLEFVAEDGPPAELCMLPMESIMFVYNREHASVVRVGMKRARDGSLPGPFSHSVMWQGTRAEWDAKVSNALKVASDWPVGLKERSQLKWLDVPELPIRYRVTNI